MDTPYDILINKAYEAKESAYSPYSSFKVGAALMCADGSIYTGCNIENASYGATLCAERVAIGKAISEGKREFLAIAIVGSGNDYCYPCGICRQVMYEFCKSDFKIVLPLENNETRVMSLEELLPCSFTNKNMK
jgi:cytidine deaminase